MKRQRAHALLYTGLFLLALAVIVYESFAKGWLLYVAVPSLLIVLPLLFVVQLKMIRHIRLGEINVFVAGVAIVQLLGVFLFYVCLPGIGENNKINVFGLAIVRHHESLVDLISYLSLVGLMASLVATVTFFVVLREEYRPSALANRIKKPKS